MKNRLIDTNVIIRFFTENPHSAPHKFKGVFSFFEKVEKGEIDVELAELVIFEAFFVLTRIYKAPQAKASEKLSEMISFRGIRMADKPLILSCLDILQTQSLGLIDAYLIAYSRKKGIDSIYSYDSDLSKQGLKLLDIE